MNTLPLAKNYTLERARRIMDYILQKEIKDRDLNYYEFDDFLSEHLLYS
jgi:hypothetical protein